MQRVKRGFTLIEILVVILIIGVITSVAMLAFGDFGTSRKVMVTAEQFKSYIELVQQRAILEMSTLGINLERNGYETLRLNQAQQWQNMTASNLFHWHPFPQRVAVSLRNNKKYRPDIIVTSSGDMTPFIINFGDEKTPDLVTLIGQDNGDIQLQKKSDAGK